MAKVLSLIALIASCASAIILPDDVNRITAGNTATDTQFPYVISLQALSFLPNQVQAHRCGGALVTYQHALTAATCTYDYVNGVMQPITPSAYRVYAGGALLSGDTVANRIRSIANITVHSEHLIYPALLNDIAVITLQTPYLNVTVVPIPIATNNIVPADFTLCTLAGWGAPNNTVAASNQLRFTTKYIYQHNLCTTLYKSLAGIANIHPSMICAVSYDIFSAGCTGDEGNPLVCNGQLTGILSLTNRCVMTPYPEVYTRVSNYTTFIRGVTGGATSFKPELSLFALAAIVCLKMFA